MQLTADVRLELRRSRTPSVALGAIARRPSCCVGVGSLLVLLVVLLAILFAGRPTWRRLDESRRRTVVVDAPKQVVRPPEGKSEHKCECDSIVRGRGWAHSQTYVCTILKAGVAEPNFYTATQRMSLPSRTRARRYEYTFRILLTTMHRYR